MVHTLLRPRSILATVALIGALTAVGVGSKHAVGGDTRLHVGLAQVGGASRTWVSGVGDDANPCSRTAPCKTFAGAITKTAAGGEIDTLDPGGFGAVTITKSITIDGLGGGKSSTLVAAGINGITVRAGANDVVTLRHLQVQGVGSGLNGIQFTSGRSLTLDDVVIENFTQNGLNVALSADGSSIVVKSSRIYHNAGNGISIATTAGAVRSTVTDTLLTNNGNGLLARDGASVDVANSVAGENTGAGIWCQISDSLPCVIHTTHDQIDHDASGIAASRSGGSASITISLSDDDIMGNTVGINNTAGAAPGTRIITFLNNRFIDNGVDGTTNVSLHER